MPASAWNRLIALSILWTASAAGFSGSAHGGDSHLEEPAREHYFSNQVLPVLQKRCLECHSHAAGKAKGGLMLDSRAGWQKGGDSGPAIVPGEPDKSLLIQALRYGDLKMPPTGRLPENELRILERWVAEGATDTRDGGHLQGKNDVGSGTGHWAFQPVRRIDSPATGDRDWPATPVDRLILKELENRGLHPSPDADRITWLRRVTFDLTGLPPSPAEIAEFVADSGPAAEERVVDRLLASTRHGERWGRHWLDLVGYADQIGTSNNIFAEHAWRYRDYVIHSINGDKPFDRFLREQIAGDLLSAADAGERAAQIVATGFLVLGDLSVVEADKAKLRVDVVDQQIEKIGKAMLGMTLACARCHDHKFDPITQRDYYALGGILLSTQTVERAVWGVWSFPTMVALPETPSEQQERLRQLSTHQQILDQIRKEQDRVRQQIADLASRRGSAGDEAARTALEQEQRQLEAALRQLDTRRVHAEFFVPKTPLAFAVREEATLRDMRVTVRGNAHALGEVVSRGFPAVLTRGGRVAIPGYQSGRRELADWIASAENPLTGRIAVNRIWQRLFGEGIVRSVDYFGLRGESPSHPELLDWLAGRFVELNWSQKSLLRELVLSRTYRQASRPNAAAEQVDPENRWLWRMSPRRLDAEAVRDALICISGKLVNQGRGPGLPLEYVENTGGLRRGEVNPPFFVLARFRPEQEFVRTVYLPIIRSGPQVGPGEIQNVFDFTQPGEFSGRRAVTTVPTQALFLMNSQLLKARSRETAVRLLATGTDDVSRLASAWLLILNRPLTSEEQIESLSFLDSLRTEIASVGGVAADEVQMRAWSELCHALFASNEFLNRL